LPHHLSPYARKRYRHHYHARSERFATYSNDQQPLIGRTRASSSSRGGNNVLLPAHSIDRPKTPVSFLIVLLIFPSCQNAYTPISRYDPHLHNEYHRFCSIFPSKIDPSARTKLKGRSWLHSSLHIYINLLCTSLSIAYLICSSAASPCAKLCNACSRENA
jgi:hypothetical protein